MNSITSAVKLQYGLNDEPEPRFQHPVVIGPMVHNVLDQTATTVEAIIDEAACAVELISRFEGTTRYVDFASRLDLPVTLRLQWLQGHIGDIVGIDFYDADERV